MTPRESPLAAIHEEMGARTTEFAGWRLPVQFHSVADEVKATRRAAALFDISHMGVVRLSGADARAHARRVLTRDVELIPPNCAAYALMCNERGGVLDDLFVMVESESAVRLVVNAVNHEKDLAWLRAHLGSILEIEDYAGSTFGLALQGQRSEDILKAAGLEGRLPAVFAAFFHGRVADADLLISRTGYTGEDGFEIWGTAQDGPGVWRALMQAGEEYGALPAGLAARDVLRQEMGYPLWGQELDEETTPLDAGLEWVIDWRGEFIGRSALEAARPKRARIGLRAEGRGVPRRGAAIRRGDGDIGLVTSGTYSHNLEAAIGQGSVAAEAKPAPSETVHVIVRGQALACRVERLPFLPRRTRASWTEAVRRHEE